ncbi:hypothetical protein C8R46DRAFT_1006578 [Mycena filopes]|nr:hypothetical protein C8R46DRAFT_1006578 [Mycena filopes]
MAGLRFLRSPSRIWFWALAILVSLFITLRITQPSPPQARFGPLLVDSVAEELGHPTFREIRQYERNLPQHSPPGIFSKGRDPPRYLFYPRASWGSGWNNVFQECPHRLLNTHLAYRAQRAYVFPNYIPRDHPPFPDTLPNGTRHMLEVPMNAFVSGPTGGGPLSPDGSSDSVLRRAVSVEMWDLACPAEEVVHVKLYDTLWELGLNGESDGKEMMDKWAAKLLEMTAPCIAIEDGSPFDYIFIGSSRVISIWSQYADSPTLKYFAWSPLITAAIFRNFHRLSGSTPPSFLTPSGRAPYHFQSFRPYRASAPPIAGLLGIHVRRGDYEGHCVNLANGGADYNAWNLLGTPGLATHADNFVWPALPDYLDVPGNQSRRDAAFDHCWPSPAAIVARARKVRDETPTQDLQRVYISTNGDPVWVVDLAAELRADGWKVASSLDLHLTLDEKAVGQAVDMSVLAAADSFIGVGFSSLSSNVVQIRLGGGRDPRTIHFW